MLIDNVSITIKAGNGGNGAATFKRNAQTAKGGPDGGNGGNGGSVYIIGSHNERDLRQFQYKKKFNALDGTSGKHKNLYGKNADDLYITLPFGTDVTEIATGKTYEITDETPILLVTGGKGGRGNNEFKSATNQTPLYAEPGGEGEQKELHLELKFIAQIGLIGLPNAGKSSLLAVLTSANPKIANYPFTTLEPNIGMLDTIAIADIPGLIEGASLGRGLGIQFLKHIEKTKILLHCIDSTDPKPHETYEIVRKEFAEYNGKLLEKKEIILLTKIDLINKETLKEKMKILKKLGKDTLAVTLYDEGSIEKLKKIITQYITKDNEQKNTI